MATAQPFVIAAVITAIPATVSSIAAWKNSHRGRKENSSDHAIVQDRLLQLDNRFGTLQTSLEKVDIKVERMDLRFDSIEDKVERHLGWHRAEAESDFDLESALKKEYKGDYPTYPTIHPNQD